MTTATTMNLIKDNMFLTHVPESERIVLMKSNAFRPALEIAGNNTLFVSHVQYNAEYQHTHVRFTDAQGVLIGRLTVGVDDYTWFHTYDMPYSVNSTSLAAESARPMYVAKAVTKNKKDGVYSSAKRALSNAKARATVWDVEAVQNIVRNAYHKLVSGRRTHVSYRDFFNHEQVGVLLAAFFGEMSALQVNPDDMAKFEEVRTLRDQRRDFRGQLNASMEAIFGKPKLLVSYIPGHGYMVSQIDVAHTFDRIVNHALSTNDKGVAVTRAPEYYRSLEDIPLDKGRDEICGKLTYLKMNLSGRANLNWSDHEYALVPTIPAGSEVVVNEGIFGSVIVSTQSTTFVMVDA